VEGAKQRWDNEGGKKYNKSEKKNLNLLLSQ
jgi:hypothetical protein